MNTKELEKEAEGRYCKGCKWRIEQCLWAWRKTNGLKEPNEKNCSCKEVPAYLAGAEPREKRIAELEKENSELKESLKKWKDAIYADVENYNDQLTKAKDILKGIVDTPMYNQMGGEMYENEEYKELIVEAEQFLSEVEK